MLECTEVGNYVLRESDEANEFYTIIETEMDTDAQEIYIYAEDAGIDLLNEIYKSSSDDTAYTMRQHIENNIGDTGFEVGTDESDSTTKKLSFEEQTASARLLYIAEQFGYEISYSFAISGLKVTHKYVNIHKQRGEDSGVQLRLNKEVDSLTVKKSIENLATALLCTGAEGTDGVNISFAHPETYSYDDGDFYVAGHYLRSRNALAKWSRYVWEDEPNQQEGYTGNIIRTFTYDTVSQSELCTQAIAELKTLCEPEVNYEIEISYVPDQVGIGDRVDITDENGGIYISSRILKLETSICDGTRKATIGDSLIKDGGIGDVVKELEDKVKENETKTDEDIEKARQELLDEIMDSKNIAELAQKAADSAQEKLEETQVSLEKAQAAAEAAQSAAETAQSSADQAATDASAAQTTADTAVSQAAAAAETAAAARQDAATAQEEIDSLGERLTTVSNEMTANYARKSDLTDATASLETKISQNAAEITSHAEKLTTIDETVNDASKKAAQAVTTANEAKASAEASSTSATAAQTAADEAKAAATTAQEEADKAKTAAGDAAAVTALANTEVEKANADLVDAQNKLGELASNVAASEEDIAAAQENVTKAQAAADKAKENAAAAQEAADTAYTAATTAQTAADNAKTVADAAQETADYAKAAAEAAQASTDALALRVTQTETDIKQTADKIELLATKDELTETIGNYYTKEQTDSVIEEKAGSISSAVTSVETIANSAKTSAENAQSTADSGIKESKTLYYAASTASVPGKPTSQVTVSDSSKYGVWNLTLPTYNEEYSYLYICTQNLTSGGEYTWTEVEPAAYDKLTTRVSLIEQTADGFEVRLSSAETDISDTKTIANTAVKDTVNLYYASSSSTTPSAPTAHVTTNNASTRGAWNQAVPTYATAYPYYFTCQEKVTGGGKYSWTTVTPISHNEAVKAAIDAAEDAQSTAEDAAKVATNYMDYSSSNGLQIGNKTSGSWSGSRAQILPSSFNILDSSGDTLSSFGSDTIYLGKNSSSATINLLNGTGYIKSSATDSSGSTYTCVNLYSSSVVTVSAPSASLSVQKNSFFGYAGDASSSYTTVDLTNTSASLNAHGSSYNAWIQLYTSTGQCNIRGEYLSLRVGEISSSREVTKLWSGSYWPNASQSLSLSETVSNQLNGIVLAWSAYTTSAQNYDWNYIFVPKSHVANHSGSGVTMLLTSSSGGTVGTKYVYISDNTITGNDQNDDSSKTTSGITNQPNKFCLRYVYGV